MSEDVTKLLYQIDYDIAPVIVKISGPEDAAVSEAHAMGLIYLSGYKYLLTKAGILLVKSGRTYEDFLLERFPSTNPTIPINILQPIKTQPGTVGFKNSWKRLIVIVNNDWIKLLIITVVGGLIIWFITK